MAEVPNEKIALIGLLASAEFVISLLIIVFASFPVVPVDVLKNKIPATGSIDEPFRLQNFMVLFVASLINRTVEVPAVATALVLLTVRLIVLPVAFTLPSIVTLSAPFKLMSGPATLPLILSAVVVG